VGMGGRTATPGGPRTAARRGLRPARAVARWPRLPPAQGDDHVGRSPALLRPGSEPAVRLQSRRGRPLVPSGREARSVVRHGLVGGGDRPGAAHQPAVVDANQAVVAYEALRQARAQGVRASRLERALIDALAARCVSAPPKDRAALDRAYADAMRDLWAKHPQDADLGALTAEALMNLRPWDLYTQDGQPQPGTEAIVGLLDEVLKLRPDHPLANHLYIHAVEGSTRPERAAAAADWLRDLQPGLSHNVHMPSHIDVRLGRWEAAAEANRKAIAAD